MTGKYLGIEKVSVQGGKVSVTSQMRKSVSREGQHAGYQGQRDLVTGRYLGVQKVSVQDTKVSVTW